jgi:predicted lipoprotein with Yx(FWY)xxD motif
LDTAGKLACDAGCTGIWVPLAAPQGGPTAAVMTVGSKLGTVMRPDGSSQVTFDGKPLYTFVQDSSGQVTGNGATDEFGGTHFTWTVATAPGGSTAPAATTTQSSGGMGY